RVTIPSYGRNAQIGPEIRNSIVFMGRIRDRDNVGDLIDPASVRIDYSKVRSSNPNQPEIAFALRAQSTATRDGAPTLLSAWRRQEDPLISGLFVGITEPIVEAYKSPSIRPKFLSAQGIDSLSWLRFL